MPGTIFIIQVKNENVCENNHYIQFFLSYRTYMTIKSTHLKQKYWDVIWKHIYVSYIKLNFTEEKSQLSVFHR